MQDCPMLPAQCIEEALWNNIPLLDDTMSKQARLQCLSSAVLQYLDADGYTIVDNDAAWTFHDALQRWSIRILTGIGCRSFPRTRHGWKSGGDYHPDRPTIDHGMVGRLRAHRSGNSPDPLDEAVNASLGNCHPDCHRTRWDRLIRDIRQRGVDLPQRIFEPPLHSGAAWKSKPFGI
jgi:hypothetical protein